MMGEFLDSDSVDISLGIGIVGDAKRGGEGAD
jgi:hypothetical protein